MSHRILYLLPASFRGANLADAAQRLAPDDAKVVSSAATPGCAGTPQIDPSKGAGGHLSAPTNDTNRSAER